MDEPSWLKVSISVNGELAEAVAEVFSRYISSGVVIENIISKNSEDSSEDNLEVFGFIPRDEQRDEIRRGLEESIWYLSRIHPLPALSFEPIRNENWMEAWKQNFHPVRIGKKIVVLPPWVDKNDYSEYHTIIINPGMAFGTGTHPTTQLSLELIERYMQPGKSVIDVGCGTGILSIAAAKLGASRLLAVDNDKIAVDFARRCLQENDISDNIEVAKGSVKNILDNQFGLYEADIVVANILAKILYRLLEGGLDKLIADDGTLILSGILIDDKEKIIDKVERLGLSVEETVKKGDWVAIVCRRASLLDD